jgi:hypothetical protein
MLALFTIMAMAFPVAVSAAATPAYPTAINGFPVILVETSTNDITLPAGYVTLVLLDTVSTTANESTARLNLNNYLESNPLPSNWSLEVYGGPGITKDEVIKTQTDNNSWQKQHGLFKVSRIQDGVSPLTAGLFQVDMFNDPQTKTLNLQTCFILAPTITGNYEGNSYAYFGNNVLTNSSYFLQSGQIYANSNSRLVWADTSTGTAVQTFSIPYVGGHNYEHSIFYYGPYGSHTKWEMICEDMNTSQFVYHIENNATGTTLQCNINDSVFFENYNTNSNWYWGFSPSTASANSAWEGYGSVVNGSWTGWQSQFASDTLFNNIFGAMSGSLANFGRTTWTLSLIPLGTP